MKQDVPGGSRVALVREIPARQQLGNNSRVRSLLAIFFIFLTTVFAFLVLKTRIHFIHLLKPMERKKACLFVNRVLCVEITCTSSED